MKKHRLRNRLIVLFLLLAYVCAIVLPYARQPAVTAATIEGFTASDFYGDSDTGQRARIISDNGEALAERIRLISQAEEEIILSTFDFNADDSGKMLLAALLSASRRGVHVSLLVDGLAYATGILGNPWFQALTREENVELKVYNPLNPLKPWNLMGRLHDKYLIADRTAYILGGRNCYDFFLGDHDGYKNYDWDVLVCCEDAGAFPSLDQLLEYFRAVWALDECHAAGSGKEGKQEELLALYSRMQEEHADWFRPVDYKELTVPARRIRLVSNPIGPQVKEPVVFYTITELMEQAEESVSIHTPYILCDDWMLGQLADICISVPEVTMMTNSVANNGNPFGAMDYYANKEKLLGSGVGMLEYDSGVSYHGKLLHHRRPHRRRGLLQLGHAQRLSGHGADAGHRQPPAQPAAAGGHGRIRAGCPEGHRCRFLRPGGGTDATAPDALQGAPPEAALLSGVLGQVPDVAGLAFGGFWSVLCFCASAQKLLTNDNFRAILFSQLS